MKTRELIALLQQEDPIGETEVCVNNAAVWTVGREPAYYDGPVQVFEFDEAQRPRRARRVFDGDKIQIDIVSIGFALECGYDLTVDYSRDGTLDDWYRHQDDLAKRADKETDLKVERDQFVNWVFFRCQGVRKVNYVWAKKIKKAAQKFFDEQMMGPDKDPVVGAGQGKSYFELREEYYEQHIRVTWDEYSRIIIERVQ